jgi:hypothetical protein
MIPRKFYNITYILKNITDGNFFRIMIKWIHFNEYNNRMQIINMCIVLYTS